jgi:hypothetical protein
MSKQTYFVVLPLVAGRKGRIAEGEPVPCASGVSAIKTAQRIMASGRALGVIAFSKTGDPDTGDYEDAVVLTVLGSVPPEVLEARAA